MQIFAVINKSLGLSDAFYFFFITAYKFFLVAPFARIVDAEILILFGIYQMYQYAKALKTVRPAPIERMAETFPQPDMAEMMDAIRKAEDVLEMSPEAASRQIQNMRQ
jgi:hypothetical protein